MLVTALEDLIGVLPAGYEPLLWVFACLVLLWLLQSTFSLIWSLLSWIGGK